MPVCGCPSGVDDVGVLSAHDDCGQAVESDSLEAKLAIQLQVSEPGRTRTALVAVEAVEKRVEQAVERLPVLELQDTTIKGLRFGE